MVLKFFNSNNLASAGILSPCSNKIMSPGTKSLVGIFNNSPSLITLVKSTTIFLRARIALSALCSWTKPITALNKRTAKIIETSNIWPVKREKRAAPIRIYIKKERNCLKKIKTGCGAPFSGISLGPNFCQRFLTSSKVNPSG